MVNYVTKTCVVETVFLHWIATTVEISISQKGLQVVKFQQCKYITNIITYKVQIVGVDISKCNDYAC